MNPFLLDSPLIFLAKYVQSQYQISFYLYYIESFKRKCLYFLSVQMKIGISVFKQTWLSSWLMTWENKPYDALFLRHPVSRFTNNMI